MKFTVRSIRFRLTLWYVLTLVAFLAASGAFGQYHLSKTMMEQADENLEALAGEFVMLFRSTEQEGKSFCALLESSCRSFYWAGYVQVFSREGDILCRTANLQTFELDLSQEALTSVAAGEAYRETVGDKAPFMLRVLTIPVMNDGKVDHIVQIAEGLGAMEEALRKLRLVLLVFSPLLLLGLGFGGWFLAGKSLAPVARITKAVKKIRADNLYHRLPLNGARDEIYELAEMFNSMLARLEDSFRRVKQFSGDASHELRTPLAILKGETEVALRWAKDTDELRRTLVSNMEEIDRMGRIIEDLLTLAKSDSGDTRLELATFSLTDLLQGLYLQGRVLGESKSIEVTLNLQVTEDIQICGDHLRLHRMLLNLLSNGIKYTPPGGRVELKLTIEGDDAVLSFSDTGYGIAEKHLPHVFDRFYRVDEARNRSEGGTGLGLSIVKWIVEAHDGIITVDSVVGEGSVFTAKLPLEGPKPDDFPWAGRLKADLAVTACKVFNEPVGSFLRAHCFFILWFDKHFPPTIFFVGIPPPYIQVDKLFSAKSWIGHEIGFFSRIG